VEWRDLQEHPRNSVEAAGNGTLWCNENTLQHGSHYKTKGKNEIMTKNKTKPNMIKNSLQ
jgi:hypothetical protein